MPKVPFDKPALTYEEQLQRLNERGLEIPNKEKACHLLESVSYYRLSGYWYPFLKNPKSDHEFKEGSTFDSAFDLYCFDREFRKLIAGELEKIEITIRAKLIYVLSLSEGPFWYRKPSLFKDGKRWNKSLGKLRQEAKRSDEQFIKSFYSKYSSPDPPSWMILEISSFGNLSHFYANLNPSKDKRNIAHYFGLDDKTFTSWIHSIVYVRNICAHHSRLWNRVMSISPRIPRKPSYKWLNNIASIDAGSSKMNQVNNRFYFVASMIIYLLNIVNPHHTFKDRFKNLLAKYPSVDTKAMGFTDNWEKESLWK